jgi:predicted ATPase
LNGIDFFSKKNDDLTKIKLTFPDYKFFDENDKIGKKLIRRRSYIEESDIKEKNDIDFESIHKPYYYKINLIPRNIESSNFNKLWNNLKLLDRKLVIEYLSDFIKYLIKIEHPDDIIKEDSNGQKSPPYGSMRAMLNRFTIGEDIREKMNAIWKNKKIKGTKRIENLRKLKESSFWGIKIIFLQNHEQNKKIYNKEKDKLISQVKILLNFIKSKKSNNQNNFFNFLKKDICKQFNTMIFYKGSFLFDPNIYPKNSRYSHYMPEERFNYMFSILDRATSFWTNKYINFSIAEAYDDPGFNNNTLSTMEKLMDNILVIPGLRKIPARYFVRGIQTNYVGAQAENLAEILAIPKARKVTNDWFKKLEIPYEIGIKKDGNYYVIVWKPVNTKLEVQQHHVGLGLPIVLPFIVQSIIARDTIIFIEEPEVHLHPKLEADLADLICYSSIERGNQFIIETHSEDFLLRILKQIRLKKLKPEDASILYVYSKKGQRGSNIEKIHVNKYGQYTTSWKDDLFAERRREFK